MANTHNFEAGDRVWIRDHVDTVDRVTKTQILVAGDRYQAKGDRAQRTDRFGVGVVEVEVLTDQPERYANGAYLHKRARDLRARQEHGLPIPSPKYIGKGAMFSNERRQALEQVYEKFDALYGELLEVLTEFERS